MSTALVPGSFDPFHLGHLHVVTWCSRLFDSVIVAVGHNEVKPSGLLDIDTRLRLIDESVAHLPNVKSAPFTGLVTVAAAKLGADCLVKGIRGASDLDGELVQANMNHETGGTPTLFVPGLGAAALVASRYVREIATRGGDVSSVVPGPVWRHFQEERTEA